MPPHPYEVGADAHVVDADEPHHVIDVINEIASTSSALAEMSKRRGGATST
jgi:hypothetical protein